MRGDLLLRPSPRMKHDLPIDLPTLEPTSTVTRPDSPRVEQVGMFLVILRDTELRRETLDILDLQLLDHLDEVCCHDFDHAQSTALAERTIGAIEGEVIGYPGRGEP